jgi:hypothetical protein
MTTGRPSGEHVRRNYRAIGAIVAFCVGLAIGWFLRPTGLDAVVEPAAETRAAAQPEQSSKIVPQDEDSGHLEEQPVDAPTLPPAEPAVRFQEQSPSRPPTTKPLPGGDPNIIFQVGQSQELTVDAGPLQRLLDAVRISCQFDPGYGAQWNNGRVSILGATWQGGPIMYDQIAMSDGTAFMLGSEGATGSKTGEVKVRVAATRTGLHFSSFVPRGDLVSTTVFAAQDDKQRFIAVMSLHAPGFNHNSSQFHGVCDVLY